jgi:hypothetical protein
MDGAHTPSLVGFMPQLRELQGGHAEIDDLDGRRVRFASIQAKASTQDVVIQGKSCHKGGACTCGESSQCEGCEVL